MMETASSLNGVLSFMCAVTASRMVSALPPGSSRSPAVAPTFTKVDACSAARAEVGQHPHSAVDVCWYWMRALQRLQQLSDGGEGERGECRRTISRGCLPHTTFGAAQGKPQPLRL